MGVDNFMLEIWLSWCIIAKQGYNIKDNSLHQDNKISIILEKNGKSFITKMTKHINIWYLFINDRVKNGGASVVWCTTGNTIGNYRTKPLQGAMFSEFRDQIMGLILTSYSGPGKVEVEQIRKV